LVLANIDRTTLVDVIPKMKGFVKAEGKLILSGILTTEKEIIAGVLARCGWRICEMQTKGEWTGLVCSMEG
jgi:ribosomal protein L11 methyltransferase